MSLVLCAAELGNFDTTAPALATPSTSAGADLDFSDPKRKKKSKKATLDMEALEGLGMALFRADVPDTLEYLKFDPQPYGTTSISSERSCLHTV